MLELVAPHHCCECHKIGTLLCDDCKNNIINETYGRCIICNCACSSMNLCDKCRESVCYEKAWVVGERCGTLQKIIGVYKFQRAKAGCQVLADLLINILPVLPDDTVIVPIPTASNHIRGRGYDHTLQICSLIARRRGLKCKQLILRKTNTKQRQASLKQRQEQAKDNFFVEKSIDINIPYLLIDDVYTTGSTLKYASEALHRAGVKNIWIAVIARQRLD